VVALPISSYVLWRAMDRLPEVTDLGQTGQGVFRQRAVVAIVGREWTSFVSGAQRGARHDSGSIARRFRLVGTMVQYSSRLTDERRAVLDDRQKGTQRVVSEGELLDGVAVVRILRDRVVLRQGGNEETLMLKFEGEPAGGLSASGAGSATQSMPGATASADAAGSENRFGGRQVGENKWVFDRGPILRYYSELMDNPDRLVKVFDSFKPVYGSDRRVSGYRLQVEGEPDFFQSVGLREGDIVRNVNTMRMTSRRRAEFFIREFIDNRANSFTLDVERGGQTVTQTYDASP
jgi:type II secretion system protein C